ncbi:MAG TPA: hypothetical protein VEI97_00875 [bacterium]|nr:hypothetical protein [bacterium]
MRFPVPSAKLLAASGLLLPLLSIAASPRTQCLTTGREVPGVTTFFDPWLRHDQRETTELAEDSGTLRAPEAAEPVTQDPIAEEPPKPVVSDRLPQRWRTAGKEELKDAFTEVARNLGAFENAYYSYTLEFREVPPTAQAMKDTGHLRARLINPYNGQPAEFPGAESIAVAIRSGHAIAGDIWYRPEPANGQVGMAGLFLDPNEPTRTKWMRRDITMYFNEADRRTLFEQGDSREAQLTRVAMEHIVSAIADFEMRFGRVPESFEELKTGDTAVDLSNAYHPDALITESTTLSPGDLHYMRLDDDTYDLIGWGDAGPAYYYSEARRHWSVVYDPETETAAVREIPDNELRAIDPARYLAERQWGPNETVNKLVLFELHDYAVDQEHKAEWLKHHPDCPDCGSFYPYLDYSTGEVQCRDAETRLKLDDCCCQDLERQTVE